MRSNGYFRRIVAMQAATLGLEESIADQGWDDPPLAAGVNGYLDWIRRCFKEVPVHPLYA